MIVCSCTACGRRLKVKDTLAGKQVRCPGCGHRLTVPAGGPAAVSTESWPAPADGDTTAAPAEATAGNADTTARLDFPRFIGRFQVVEVLGAGGFGRVYKAYDPQLDREVAVKVPLRGTLETREEIERFLREARAAATLRHPNLCPVYEVGQDGDCHYLVMAYVHGKSLAEHLKERGTPVPARQAALVVRKLARALAVAHAQGVVHRDLKPGNVLVDRDRHDVVVTDFGLARRFHAEDAERTQEGVVLGTPAYMAPEQAGGQRDEIGPACDIYSLGVILYEMLAGRRPFTGSKRELLDRVVRGDPEPPSRHRPGIDPRLEAVCLKAIARDRRDRYESMTEFAAALDGYLKGAAAEPVAAPPVAADSAGFAEMIAALSAERQKETQQAIEDAVGRHARRTVRLVLAGLAFVSVLVAVGIAAMLLRPAKVVQIMLESKIDARLLQDGTVAFFLDGAPLPAADLRRPVELSYGEHTLVARRGDVEVQRYTFLVSYGADSKDVVVEVTNQSPYVPPQPPGERRRLYFANVQLAHRAWQDGDIEGHWARLYDFMQLKPEQEDFRGFEFYYVLQLRQQDYVRCRGAQPNSGAWSALRFSPDGQRLAGSWALQQGQQGLVWELGGQGLRFSRLRDVGKPLAAFPERLLGFSADGGSVWGVAADGSVTKRDARTGNAARTQPNPGRLPTLSPDGRRLAAVDEKSRVVTVRDADTWAVIATLPGQPGEATRLSFSPDGQRLATGWPDGGVRLWDIGTNRVVTTFKEHQYPVTALAYSPDGTRLASSDDRTDAWPEWTPGRMLVWDAATGKVLHALAGRRLGPVNVLEFSPDGAMLASAAGEVAPALWDVPTGRQLRDFKGHFGVIEALAFRPDGKYLAAGAHDGSWVYVWPVQPPQGPLTFPGHSAAVLGVAFRPDNRQLASLGADGSVALWEPRSGRKQWSLTWPGVARIGFSRDGALLIGWAADGKAIQAAAAPSGKPAPVQEQFHETMQKSPDGSLRVERVEQDGKRKTEIRDTASNSPRIEAPESPVVVFSPDGKRVALRHADGAVEVRDLADGRSLWRDAVRFGAVAALTFSPDGKRLFTAGSVFTSGPSRAVKVWDADTGLLALTLQEDRQLGDCLAVSPNGWLVAAGSRDGTIHVWDADPASVPVPER